MHINPQGKVALINGATDTKISNPTNTVKRSKQTAISKAFDAINIIESEAKNFSGSVVKKAELNIDGDAGQYVYDLELTTTSPTIGHWNIKINAENGQNTAKQSLIETAATAGLGLGITGSYKTININSVTGAYTLEDLTHTGRLETYQYNSSTGHGTIVSDTDKTFNAANQKAAVVPHY